MTYRSKDDIKNKPTDIELLVNHIQSSNKGMSKEEKIKVLKKANILDDEGYLHPGFFPEEVVKKDREVILE